MLRIRLTRTGKKTQKSFRIVVAEHTNAVKGKYIEMLGHYNPNADSKSLVYDKDKILDWIKKGAQPSDTVAALLKKDGVSGMEKYITFSTDKKRKKKKGGDEEETAAPAAESQADEQKKEEAPAA